MKKKIYEEHLETLEIELTALANGLRHSGRRLAVVFEGRDTAGKGGVIAAIANALNPRQCRVVALPKPDEREQGQWYFQRYVAHLPSAGEIVLFDRSWYNRAGVEKIMGFCDENQYQAFLRQVPVFEQLLVDDGIILLKYWLAVDQAEQEQRFSERCNDSVKRWKLSPIDLVARTQYEAYTEAREVMFQATHRPQAPWFAVDFNDQRLGRLNLIRHLLDQVPVPSITDMPINLPPLPSRHLKQEVFTGPVQPIRNRF